MTDMYQVVLYAAIATIVCVMLYTVLGKSVGQGPEAGLDAFKDKKKPHLSLVPPSEEGVPKTGLEAIAQADSNFSDAEADTCAICLDKLRGNLTRLCLPVLSCPVLSCLGLCVCLSD